MLLRIVSDVERLCPFCDTVHQALFASRPLLLALLQDLDIVSILRDLE